MSTRFTRVTVVGDGRQMDISLPADTPIGEQLPTVLRLLSVPNAPVPVRWRLAAPEFGSLDPARSLDEVGVLDGASLYLTEAATAPPPPFVDDVESAVAQEVADRAPSWTGPARRSAVGVLLAILLLAWELSAVTSAPAPLSWLAPLVALVVALGGAALITERGGWFCGITAVPAAAALVLGVVATAPFAFELPDGSASQLPATGLSALGAASFWNGFPLAVGVAAAATVALLGLVRSAPGLAVGGGVVAVLAAGVLWCVRLGIPVERTAGLVLVVAVVLAGVAGQAALGGAGLVDLMVSDERGEPVPRQAVVRAVRRGLSLAGGMVWAAVVAGAASCWALLTHTQVDGTPSQWVAPAVGALGGALFALRSRMFTRAAHVGPMVGVAVLVLVGIAVRAPTWLYVGAAGPLVTLLVLLASGVLVAGSGLGTLREVAGARLQRALERLELVAVLALVPGLVLLFRVIPMVQRWWS